MKNQNANAGSYFLAMTVKADKPAIAPGIHFQ